MASATSVAPRTQCGQTRCSQRLSLLAAVAQQSPTLEPFAAAADRGSELADQGEFGGLAVEQFRSHSERGHISEAQRAIVLRGRLAMGADRGGGSRCCRREAENRVRVARLLGVMGQARRLGATAGSVREGRQRLAVEGDSHIRRE